MLAVAKRITYGETRARSTQGRPSEPRGVLRMIAQVESQVSVIVMAVRVNPRVRKVVEQRDTAGLCLLCDEKAVKRGLCHCHYKRYRAAMYELPKRERPNVEARLIEAGKLIENRQGQRRDVINVFRQFASSGG
jgi:hypothetical protein